jgi:hypothetical protein
MEQSDPRRIGDILKEKERNIEIIGADLATRHGFTQVPNFILPKADISVGARLTYAMLLKYAWYPAPPFCLSIAFNNYTSGKAGG